MAVTVEILVMVTMAVIKRTVTREGIMALAEIKGTVAMVAKTTSPQEETSNYSTRIAADQTPAIIGDIVVATRSDVVRN